MNRKAYREWTIGIAFVCLGWASLVSAQDSEQYRWSVTPYLWGADTALDLSLRDGAINGGAQASFGDLLDVIDTAFQIQIEGEGGGKWSGFGDLNYISTSDTTRGALLVVDTKNEQTTLDGAVAFWPQGVGSKLNVFGGLRYMQFDDRYRFAAQNVPVLELTSRNNYSDVLLGIRYRFELSERWSILTRGDVSFGQSDGTWLVYGLFAYSVGERRRNRVLFGYQYKRMEFSEDRQTTNVTNSGPLAGFNFRF